jgi:hypothetical protein
MIRPLPLAALCAMLLAGCGSAAAAQHHPRSAHAATSAAAVASPANEDPNRAADTALCRIYNSDITAGDTADLETTLQQDAGTVSPKLAAAMQAVVNAGANSKRDLLAQVKVTADCVLVKTGRSPAM